MLGLFDTLGAPEILIVLAVFLLFSARRSSRSSRGRSASPRPSSRRG